MLDLVKNETGETKLGNNDLKEEMRIYVLLTTNYSELFDDLVLTDTLNLMKGGDDE